jgi:hypothetical protein
MARKRDSGLPTRIGHAEMAGFLKAVRAGERLEDAARAQGFTRQAFQAARGRDPLFALAWNDCYGASAEAERRQSAPADGPEAEGEVRIACANRRIFQRRRMRHVLFTDTRKETFLARFAQDCDSRAAAAAAGVSESTVANHVRKDPAFAAAYREALEIGYALLEEEVVRQRLAAQQRLREAVESAAPSGQALADEGAEFERVMRVLARRDRKPRAPERHFPGGRREEWTFDRAIVALDKRLRSLGLRKTGLEGEGGG